MKLQLILI